MKIRYLLVPVAAALLGVTTVGPAGAASAGKNTATLETAHVSQGGPSVLADFNGDGFRDLAVGVPLEDFKGTNDGVVNVIYGSQSGLSATVTPDQLWSQDSPGVEGGAESEDRFGSVLTAANFGGSSQADLAVGVPLEDFKGTNDGVVNVIYGSAARLSATVTPDQLWSQDSPGVEGGAENEDQFGSALAAP
jgi:FG-GAP repeat